MVCPFSARSLFTLILEGDTAAESYFRLQMMVKMSNYFFPGQGQLYMSRIVRKRDFCLCENKGADQLRGNPKLISAFVFAIRIVYFLFYLNPKFQASSSFLSLYRPVCVGPGRKPRRPVFSHRGSYGAYT